MKSLKNREKVVVAGKLLTTSDGKKMGKSEGNMIMLSDTPENIYGKVMAFPDEQIVIAYELLTDYELDQVHEVEKELKAGANPMEYKKRLAFEVVKGIKGEQGAQIGQQYFESVFQKKDYDTNIQEISISNTDYLTFLVEKNIVKSKGEARRLMEQGAIKVNENKIENTLTNVELGILRVGKRVYKIV